MILLWSLLIFGIGCITVTAGVYLLYKLGEFLCGVIANSQTVEVLGCGAGEHASEHHFRKTPKSGTEAVQLSLSVIILGPLLAYLILQNCIRPEIAANFEAFNSELDALNSYSKRYGAK
jgi:hypothetical protein